MSVLVGTGMAMRGFMDFYDDTAVCDDFVREFRRELQAWVWEIVALPASTSSMLLFGSVMVVGGGDGFVETLGERVRVAGGQAGGWDGVAYHDQEGPGIERVDVDGQEFVGSYQRERNEGN